MMYFIAAVQIAIPVLFVIWLAVGFRKWNGRTKKPRKAKA